MIKELEALETMGCATLEEDNCVKDIYYEEYDIVKQALLKLQAIKEAKPSEAMVKDIKEQAQDILNATHIKKDDYKDMLDKAIKDIVKETIATRVSEEYLEKRVKEQIDSEVRYNLSRELISKIRDLVDELVSKIEISFKD